MFPWLQPLSLPRQQARFRQLDQQQQQQQQQPPPPPPQQQQGLIDATGAASDPQLLLEQVGSA